MIDPVKLREALESVDRYFDKTGFMTESWPIVAQSVRSLLPKTKMIEVWRVEWAHQAKPHQSAPFWQPTARHYEREYVARAIAKTLENEGNNACIRVTGPHMQEVPGS